MSIRILSLVSLLGALALASLARAEEQPDYEPLAVGCRWKAQVVANVPGAAEQRGTSTRTVTATKLIDGETWFVCETSFEGLPGWDPYTVYRRRTPTGMVAIHAADVEAGAEIDFPLPVVVGRTWEQRAAESVVKLRIDSLEPVTVGDKTYENCCKVSYKASDFDFHGHLYLAPGIGNVREVMVLNGVTLDFTLSEFTPPPTNAPTPGPPPPPP